MMFAEYTYRYMLLFGAFWLSTFSLAQDERWQYDAKDGVVYVRIADTTRADTDSIMSMLGFKKAELQDCWESDSKKESKEGWTLSKFNEGFIEFSQRIEDMAADLDIKELFREKFWETDYKSVPQDETWGVNVSEEAEDELIYPSEMYRFSIEAPGAEWVVLSGTFNEWDTQELQMIEGPNGLFFTDVKLPAGQHLYKFIVDGNWIVDPANELSSEDHQGNLNSVFYAPNKVFQLHGYSDAKKVVVTGNFNDWDEGHLRMERRNGRWELPIYLRPDTYVYKFIVDGQWINDPMNPLRMPNEFGEENSVLEHGEAVEFELEGYMSAEQVYLAGSFNDWQPDKWPMNKSEVGWVLRKVMPSGNYDYRYVVDGTWVSDKTAPVKAGPNENNVICVEPNHTFSLSGLSDAKEVVVTGDFIDWSHEGFPMQWNGEAWEADVFIPLGKTKYRFIVDGEWMQDYDNPWYENNEFGEPNSIVWKTIDDIK